MIPQISPRILLVEDEPALVLLLTDLFRAQGYEVDSVSDGEAGLSKALTRQHSVIVLDVMLPKKSGFDVCKELRQAGVDTAILMLTAKTLVGDRVAGLKLAPTIISPSLLIRPNSSPASKPCCAASKSAEGHR